MKPQIETIAPAGGSSFGFVTAWPRTFRFLWHVHPEAELTYIHRGYGRRFVGDDISSFEAGDLVLLGGNLPHTWASDPELSQKRRACHSSYAQFLPDFLGKQAFAAPEFLPIARLLHRAQRGLLFTGKVRREIELRFITMARAAPAGRLMLLLECLQILASDRSAKPICSTAFAVPTEISAAQQSRIGDVRAFLNAQFARPVSIAEAAKVAHLSVHSFGRFFRRSTGKGFTDYLGELRIGRACDLLIRTDRPITSIASEAGFENLSNFNRRFLAMKGMRPREYRRAHSM